MEGRAWKAVRDWAEGLGQSGLTISRRPHNFPVNFNLFLGFLEFHHNFHLIYRLQKLLVMAVLFGRRSEDLFCISEDE